MISSKKNIKSQNGKVRSRRPLIHEPMRAVKTIVSGARDDQRCGWLLVGSARTATGCGCRGCRDVNDVRDLVWMESGEVKRRDLREGEHVKVNTGRTGESDCHTSSLARLTYLGLIRQLLSRYKDSFEHLYSIQSSSVGRSRATPGSTVSDQEMSDTSQIVPYCPIPRHHETHMPKCPSGTCCMLFHT
jgi:hypothetical protein